MIPKISVIVPVYNVEKYLEQCLDSIVNQTLKETEIIVVDDGSTDKSKNIISNYEKEFSNIIVIYQENKGVSIARNNALKKTSGEYVFYMDSDDFLELNCLELLYKKAKNTKADIVIYGHKEIYESNNYYKESIVRLDIDEGRNYSGKEVGNMILNCKFLGVVWNKLFKRENLIINGLYFEENRYVQDWYPVFVEIFKSQKVCFLNKALYNYRVRNTSTTSKKTKKNIDDYYYAASNIIKYAINNNFESKYIIRFKIIAFNTIISRYYNLYPKYKKDIYSNFELTEYYNIKLGSREILKTANVSNKMKLNIISWNMKSYHLLMNFEQYIRGNKK